MNLKKKKENKRIKQTGKSGNGKKGHQWKKRQNKHRKGMGLRKEC